MAKKAKQEKKSKFNNHKVEYEGQIFDSELEVARYVFLKNREKEGLISNLQRQVYFLLIPRQTKMVEKQMKTKVKMVERVVERECGYKADFIYERDGETIVEDVKGKSSRFNTETADFKIKKKLMYYFYKIEINIINSPTKF